MSQTPPTAPTRHDPTGGLAKVQRLATELAARMRYAQIVERPLPPEQVAALVAAARLLQERGESWPEIVGEVLRQIAEDLTKESQAEPVQEEEDGNRVVAGLTRFLGAFRREQASTSRD